MSRMIPRHDAGAIFIHWFNAVCWLFLLATGLGLVQNPDLQPLGAWYPNTLRRVFGGGGGLLLAHLGVAGAWLAVWLVFILVGIRRYTLPFLAEILSYSLPRDLHWLVKKNFQMTLGYKAMAKLVAPLGWDGRIPDQPFYNAGQKAAAVALVLGGLGLAATGTVMAASKYALDASQVVWVQWSITLHYAAAGLTTVMLLVHVYMAAISKEERPAFWSMFKGRVPADYARHHHKLWYDQLTK